MTAPRHRCSIEWIAPAAGVVRIHEGGAAALGDPYVWACTLERRGPLATLKGVCSPPPPGAARVLCDELHRQGMRLRSHERRGGASGPRVVLKVIRPPRTADATGA